MTDFVSALYLDANVFIDLVEGEPALSDRLRELFKLLEARPGLAVTSELTIAEVLAPAARPQAIAADQLRSLYVELLSFGGFVDLEPVSRQILTETADYRRAAPRKIKLPDAIHMVTAVRRGCSHVLSRDTAFRDLPQGFRYVDTSSSEVESLVGLLS